MSLQVREIALSTTYIIIIAGDTYTSPNIYMELSVIFATGKMVGEVGRGWGRRERVMEFTHQ